MAELFQYVKNSMKRLTGLRNMGRNVIGVNSFRILDSVLKQNSQQEIE